MAWTELEPIKPRDVKVAPVKFCIGKVANTGDTVGILSLGGAVLGALGKLRISTKDGKHVPRRIKASAIVRLDLEDMTKEAHPPRPCPYEVANGELILTLPSWALTTTAPKATPLAPPTIPQRGQGLTKDVTAALMGDPARRRA